MELVYLWVEDYKNIKKQGFNFSPRFKCEYDEENKRLDIIDKDETGEFYPKNFFGEKINITAIVGENGSGKTSIQSLLNTICSRINVKLKTKYILLTSINNHIHYQSNFNFIKENTLIENIHNISVVTYLNSIEEKTTEEFNKQLTYMDKINSIKLSNYEINQLMTMHIQEKQPFPETQFFYFPKRIIIKPIDFSELFEQIVYREEKEFDNSLDLLELFENINDNYHKFLILFYIEKNVHEIRKLNNVRYLEEEFKKYELYINREEFGTYFSKKIYELDSLNKKEKDIYLDDFNNYFEIDYIDSKERNWSSLSTGEQVSFGIFLNLYFFYRTAENLQNNLLITFDEIELCLHPNWQKSFLIRIIDFLKKLNNKYNVIISTHSPFLLSDIPKENVIFLEKGKQVYPFEDNQQTFGANIHTLLSHGFFMKDGLMGEFAKEKINDVYDFLTNENTQSKLTQEKAQNIISIVGEPILKKELQSIYDKKFQIDDIDKKIREHQKAIQKLESQRNNND